MRIVVYEYVSGGGYTEQPIPPSVLSEGFAMLRTVVCGFAAAGHEVTVLLDSRISQLNPPLSADCIIPVSKPQEALKSLSALSKINDAYHVIAPETGQTLRSIVELVEQTGKVSLNCESSAIGKVSDKAFLFGELQKLGFAPRTAVLSLADSVDETRQVLKSKLSFPLVLKPADGVSCGGLSLVTQESQLEKAVEKIKAATQSNRFIAQEFINGKAASVSLLCTGKKALAVSLNKQNINLAAPDADSSYQGGAVPYQYWLVQDSFRIAEKAVETFAGLRGYVGVDLVLTEHKPYIVDVNPRLTTSFVGLSKVANFNVAEAILNAVKGTPPTNPQTKGFSCFSKIQTPPPTLASYQQALELGEVVSPPFPLNDAKASALLASQGETLDVAEARLEEAKKRLWDIMGR